MTNTDTTGTIYSTYQAERTSYGVERAIAWVTAADAHQPNEITSMKPAWVVANEINGDLHRRAEALAPRYAEETAQAGCTNIRSTKPRQRKAWDMIAEAHTWNMVCDRENNDLAEAVLRALAAGKAVRLAHNYSQFPMRLEAHVDGVWVNPPAPAPVLPLSPAQEAQVTERSPEVPSFPVQGDLAASMRPSRHTHTDAVGNVYRTYATSELRPGDVVANSGMLIFLVDHGPVTHHLMDVFVAHGYVLNSGDETVRSLVGNLLYTWDDHYSCHAARWTVQGNDLATWQVLSSGPRLDALHIAPAIEAAEREARCGTAAGDIPHYLMIPGRSLELSLAATALVTGTDVSRLPSGVLRRHEDAAAPSASRFCAGIDAYRKAHLS